MREARLRKTNTADLTNNMESKKVDYIEAENSGCQGQGGGGKDAAQNVQSYNSKG